MRAQVRFLDDTSGTIFPTLATGHVLVVQTGEPLDGARLAILIDDASHRRLEEMLAGERPTARVLDILTRTAHIIERADCGLGCRCAARIVRSEAFVA